MSRSCGLDTSSFTTAARLSARDQQACDSIATKRILFLIWYTLSVCGFTRGLGVYTIEGFFWLWIHMKPSGDSILGTKKIILIKSRPGRFQQSTTKDKVPLESCYLTCDRDRNERKEETLRPDSWFSFSIILWYLTNCRSFISSDH